MELNKNYIVLMTVLIVFVLLFYSKNVSAEERGFPSCSEFGMEEFYKNLAADIVQTFPEANVVGCTCGYPSCDSASLTLSGKLFLQGEYEYLIFIHVTKEGNITIGPEPFTSSDSLEDHITQLEKIEVVNRLINQYATFES